MSASTRATVGAVRQLGSAIADRVPLLTEAYRFTQHPRWQLDIWRDVGRTRRQAAFLRGLAPPAADAPLALAALYRDDIYETKVALSLLAGLRLRGMRAGVIVPSRRMLRVTALADAFGVRLCPCFDDEPLTEADLVEREAMQREVEPLDFAELKATTFHGHQLGTHVLSTVIRLTLDGLPDLARPEIRSLATTVTGEVVDAYVRAERLLDRLAPEVLLVEEAGYSRNGPIVDVAVDRGIDVIQTNATARDDCLVSKRLVPATRRVDPKSVDPSTLDALPAQLDASERQELEDDFEGRYGARWTLGAQWQGETAAFDRDELVELLGLDPALPTAVVFSHVVWDASLSFGTDLFESYADWLLQTVGAACENPSLNWIVKAHPSNAHRASRGDVGGEASEVRLLGERFPSLAPHVHLLLPDTPVATLSLYRFADVGVTVRGTPGLEMACFGRQVFTAGTGHYSGLGFTTDSVTREEYLERIRTLRQPRPLAEEMAERAQRYAHTLFCRRPWPVRSFALEFDIDRPGWRPLDRNVRLRAGSPADVDRAGDLGPWAEWVVEGKEVDYVPPR